MMFPGYDTPLIFFFFTDIALLWTFDSRYYLFLSYHLFYGYPASLYRWSGIVRWRLVIVEAGIFKLQFVPCQRAANSCIYHMNDIVKN